MLHPIEAAQTSEERFLRQIFVRDQMADWSKNPLLMAKAAVFFSGAAHGKRYWAPPPGIYPASAGKNTRGVIEATRNHLDTFHFPPPMHGTNPVAIQLANMIAE